MDAPRRAFCPACGSTGGAIDDEPVVAVALGCFDKPAASGFRPAADAFRGARPDWRHVAVIGNDPDAAWIAPESPRPASLVG